MQEQKRTFVRKYLAFVKRLMYDKKKRDGMDKMKLVYGTTNAGKLAVMKRCLAPLKNIELISLNEVDVLLPEISEIGNTPLENARIKAKAYYKVLGVPVFSCDSGLYFEEIPEELQPGVHVRNVNGKYLTDEEMTEYYSNLARKYGDLTAWYKNAICLVMDETHIYESMDKSLWSEPFLLTCVPHTQRQQGFPLDCLSKHIETGEYYYDMGGYRQDDMAAEKGFLEFFRKITSL